MAGSSQKMKTIIASYQKSKVWPRMLLFLVVVALLPYATFWSYGGHFISRLQLHGSFWISAIILAWLLGFLTLLIGLLLIRQLVFRNGVAVWIDNGALIVLHRWLFSADCDQIERLSCGVSGITRQRAIFLHMRDGSQKVILAGGLSESCATIVSRLNAEIKLPDGR